MSIELLVLDVDGTLTNDDGDVGEENILAVKRAVKNGVKVVLATGRHREGVQRVMKKLGLSEDIPLILTNGSMILKGEEIWLKDFMTSDEVAGVIAYGSELGDVVITVFLPDKVYYWVPPAFKEGLAEEILNSFDMYTKEKVEKPEELPLDNVTKMMFLAKEHKTASKALSKWPQNIDSLKRGHSLDYLCEINNSKVDKGKALEIVCKRLDIPLSKVLAVGDGQNDIPILTKSKYGVFVKKSDVKVDLPENVAVTPPGYGDMGVAWAIKKYEDLI